MPTVMLARGIMPTSGISVRILARAVPRTAEYSATGWEEEEELGDGRGFLATGV